MANHLKSPGFPRVHESTHNFAFRVPFGRTTVIICFPFCQFYVFKSLNLPSNPLTPHLSLSPLHSIFHCGIFWKNLHPRSGQKYQKQQRSRGHRERKLDSLSFSILLFQFPYTFSGRNTYFYFVALMFLFLWKLFMKNPAV